MRFEISSRATAAAAVLLAALLASACGGGEPGDAKADPRMGEAEASRALVLFQGESCSACHGDLADGLEGTGPALRSLAPYWDVARLKAYLADPEGFREANPDFEDRRSEEYPLEMPAFDHLEDAQRDLLARWLMER